MGSECSSQSSSNNFEVSLCKGTIFYNIASIID